jgi:N-carbamoyl-L-amino-acid hydrolase
MEPTHKKLRINRERFKQDFDELAQIGATADGGVHRPSLSPAHLEARAWFRQRIEQAGLVFRMDGAGNHSAFLRCGPRGAATLLLGSHLDSVRHGGRFDGPLGVLAALETLRVVNESGLALPVNFEAIDFTDEEGTLVGLLGSSALAGTLEKSVLQSPRGGRERLEAGLERSGLTEDGFFTVRRDPDTLAGYLELHIEQGRRLAASGTQIGVVHNIVGGNSYRLTFIGRADHAGTVGMEERRDAAQGACEFTLAVRQLLTEDFPGCVANVGDMAFDPGAFNIVPGRVAVSLEFRAPDVYLFDELERALLEVAASLAEQRDLKLNVEWLGKWDPAPMSPIVQNAITEAADSLNLKHMTLNSGAGHDAQSLAPLCPAGMIFVPSVDGASHSAREFTHWQDCVNGANVLLRAALRLAAER